MSNVFSRTLGEPIPQSEQADSRQVQNNAGGYTFTVTSLDRLLRFLILGTEGGTYYQDEKQLTKDNVAFLQQLIDEDEQLVIDTVREVSLSGRAYRNSPAIFATAAIFAYGKIKPKSLVTDVCRIGTHLFEFAEYVELLGGWSRAKRAAIETWYQTKGTRKLAYDAIKYRQRNGWSHKDVMRLSHPVGIDRVLGNYILGKPGLVVDERPELDILRAFLVAQEQTDVNRLLSLLDEPYARALPWEAIPTQFHKEYRVWAKLFYNGALSGQALVRNITRLARLNAFSDMKFAADYAAKLTDVEMIKRTRLHPFQYLLAGMVHQNGQRDRDNRNDRYWPSLKKDWTTSSVISTALEQGFYSSFNYVEPANKRFLLGLDISGSMSSSMCGIDLTAAQCAAAMAMIIARTEPMYQIMGFGYQFRDLGITANMSLQEVLNRTERQTFGGTDCSLPMRYALQNSIEVDTFVVITDNETWAGAEHPHISLQNYRRRMNIPARLIVVACTPSSFTIADPSDKGMLDIVGADTNLPKLITEFATGRI